MRCAILLGRGVHMGDMVADAGGLDDGVSDEVELDVDELESLDLPEAPPPMGARGSVPPPIGLPASVPPPPGARGSVPPPLGARGNVPPPLGSRGSVPPPIGARGSVPPPVPARARELGSRPPASRSGTWRVADPAPRPAPPTPTSVEALQRELVTQERRSREDRATIARLRLGNKLRDDRIAALESELSTARARVVELERALASRPPDDLKRISGIGPAYERALRELGVEGYADIAAWADADVTRVAAALGIPRVRVEPWIAQARTLRG